MTANVPVKAISSGELATLNTQGHWCELGLYIQRPATVYTMRINQDFTSRDRVAELIYDGGAGIYTDAVANMLVLVSATAYGKHDKGMCRLRKDLPSATTGIISINETSHIQFQNNDFLTIVKAMPIWQKDLTVDGGIIKMDYDVEFGNYSHGGCTARLGPIVAIVDLVETIVGETTTWSASFSPVSPDRSECYDGAAIVSYHYECPNAVSIEGADTTSPMFHFDAAGEYLYWCEVTDNIGRVTKSYRWVIVAPVSENFIITENPSGDTDKGGWSYKVRVYSADLSDVHDRSMVTLYKSKEVHNFVVGSLGKLPGYENIINTGWIDGKTINLNSVEGYVEFEVKDASFWLSKVRSFPFGVEDVSDAPINWVQVRELTVDKALHHLLFWTTNATSIMDCFYTRDTKRIKELSSPSDNLWAQIGDIALGTIFAKPIVNSLGQLFVEVDQTIIPSADQAAIPVVMDIQQVNVVNGFEIGMMQDETSLLNLSGITAWDGSNAYPLFSKAPGSIGSTLGSIANEENYVFADQDDCNRIAGVLYALANNKYETIDLELAAQNMFFDIAPRQFAAISISAADNPLGVELTNVKIIPRSVEYEYTPETGLLATTISFEFLVNSVQVVTDGITYIPPVPTSEDLIDNYSIDKINSKIKIPNFPAPNTWFPPYVPPPIPSAPCGSQINSYTVAWDKAELRGEDEDRVARVYFPCKVRPKGNNFASPSKVSIIGAGYADAGSHLTLYGIKDGERVITADVNFEFDSFEPIEVDGFELELDAGLGSPLTYTPLDVIASGVVNAYGNNTKSITSGMVAGNYYSVEGSSSYWNWANYYPWNTYAWRNGLFSLNGFDGRIGRDGNGGTNKMVLRTPSICLYSEQVNVNYGRTYFLYSGADITINVGDTLSPWDNVGSLGYAMRNARVDGRRILLSSATISNICPIGEA